MKAKIVAALTLAAAVGAVLMKIIDALLEVLQEAPVDPAAADSTVTAISRVIGLG
jgi:hypothetical protein